MTESKKNARWLFEHLFLQYGAGSGVFKPVQKWRCLNVVSWVLIVLGFIGWGFFIWFLRVHFPE